VGELLTVADMVGEADFSGETVETPPGPGGLTVPVEDDVEFGEIDPVALVETVTEGVKDP